MGRSLKNLISLIAGLLWLDYKRKSINYAKIEGVKLYLEAVRAARSALTLVVVLFFLSLCGALGLFLLIVSIAFFLPISDEVRIGLLVIIGAISFGAPLLLFLVMNSERNWMKFSKADRLINKVLNSKD